MVTRDAAISEAQSFINECKRNGLSFKKVLLFGSYAEDKAHEWSDIDLLMISDQFTGNIFHDLKLFSKINIKYPQIEAHPYSYKHFIEGNDFINEISKTGSVIV